MERLRLLACAALLLHSDFSAAQAFYDPAPIEIDVGWEAPPSPAADADAPAAALQAEEYIRAVAGDQAVSPSQRLGLLDLFMEERGIDPDSMLGVELRTQVSPRETAVERSAISALDERFRRFGSLFLATARRYDASPARLEALIRRHRLENTLAGIRDKSVLEDVLRRLLVQDRVETVVERYPATPQGRALRDLGGHLATKSGASAEEISRSGAFLYADFSGLSVVRVDSGRNPDVQTADVVFYAELRDGRWDIHVYRQNERNGGPRRLDSAYVRVLKTWLISGGVPAADFWE